MSSAKKFKLGEEVSFTPARKLSLVRTDIIEEPQRELPETLLSYKSEIEHAQDEISDKKNTQELDRVLQHLWKLDKLERLIYLAELQKLEKLDKLEYLDKLDELEHVVELRHLKELNNLGKLKDLKSLDKLNHLLRLKHLDKLDSLKELDQLKQLEMMEMLKQLDKLIYLNKLEGLRKLDKLDGLVKVEELRVLLETHSEHFDKFAHLAQLEKLDNLKRLENLNRLSDLEKLSSLEQMEKLTELKSLEKLVNLQSLYKLDKLDDLAKLERLSKLDQLHYLEKLDNMQDLSKLDTLKDEEVRASMSYLSKLDLFKGTNKHFIGKLALASLFDIVKITVVAVGLLFVLTKNVSYQTFNRLVPYIGFGEADRVNIALSILSQDLSNSEFDKIFKDLEARVKREASTLFDHHTPKGMNEYRIAENLMAYNYTVENYDIGAISKKERTEWADKVFKKYNLSYEYDLERLAPDMTVQEDIQKYREASIFIKQQKFVKAFDMFNQIKQPKKFEALGHGRAYAFYMAFVNSPKELKTTLEK